MFSLCDTGLGIGGHDELVLKDPLVQPYWILYLYLQQCPKLGTCKYKFENQAKQEDSAQEAGESRNQPEAHK